VEGLRRAFYVADIGSFMMTPGESVLGALAEASEGVLEREQRDAWLEEVRVMREALTDADARGLIAFEFAVPRVGRRIDVLMVLRHVVFVLEFKAGASRFAAEARDQVWDYALDLHSFHSASHDKPIAPILVATGHARAPDISPLQWDPDGVMRPALATPSTLRDLISRVLESVRAEPIDKDKWLEGRYHPTPTIIEAARALYSGHGVGEITRSDAGAFNLANTCRVIEGILEDARSRHRKALCLVTGVPGAGKTLLGLNIATRHRDERRDLLHSVLLSGNGPLVAVLREALARDRATRSGSERVRIGQARREVRVFIQNVHHYRDECLADEANPPHEHVVLFDEAQRAWNRVRTEDFMRRRKNRPGFAASEPEFLISCMDRHRDWAVIVCLVGGGQEINTGEAGIGEWVSAVLGGFPHWDLHLSGRLYDSEYGAGEALRLVEGRPGTCFHDDLHLAVSMRSFRAEHLSGFVKNVLDLNVELAGSQLASIRARYPVVLTRDLSQAKAWLRSRARGSERYGMVVSSQAQRLKPHAIDVRVPLDPVQWFLAKRDDVRSSCFLEDAASEFHVQGLELDWTCVVWDGDFRYSPAGWGHYSFRGDRWRGVRSANRRFYQKNAYRVLLTRARQGMVIVVPEGSRADKTRAPEHYDSTFEYLRGLGLPVI
jgi:hypothetical protein